MLLEYTTQFIDSYSKAEIPWAAFAHFVDTHDDSPKSLDRALDRPIEKFLMSIDGKLRSDTIIVVTSDHGLHYGPFFNTDAGRRERAEPVLHMRLAGLSKRRGHRLEAENRHKRITAFESLASRCCTLCRWNAAARPRAFRSPSVPTPLL